MYRKSIWSGVLIGILLSLALAVTVYDQVSQAIAGWRWFDLPWIPRDLVRSFSQNAGALLLLFVGTLAALRAHPRKIAEGIQVGALSGATAGLVLWAVLLAPANAIRVAVPFHVTLLNAPGLPNELANQLFNQAVGDVLRTSLIIAIAAPVLGLLLGALEGFVVALVRRAGGHAAEPAPPDLLDVVRQPRPARRPDPHERPLRAGLVGGLLGGALLFLALMVLVLPGLVVAGPSALVQLQDGSPWPQGLEVLAIVALPVSLLLWGGSGVLFLAHPPDRFRSRFLASLNSGAVAGVVFGALFVLPLLNVAILALPLAASAEGQKITTEWLFAAAHALTLAYPVLLIGYVFLQALWGLLTGLPIALLSAYLWPRRPVDRAASLTHRLRRHPADLLPQIYALFQRDRQALEVLEQTALYLQRARGHAAVVVAAVPGQARVLTAPAAPAPAAAVAGAFHTLHRNPARATEALGVIVESLAQNEGWRWQSEIGELHRFLREGLQARNVYHLAALRPLPEERTSSLPPLLAQAGERLSRAVGELKKAQRVDDPQSRTIYLNRALEEITAAEVLVTCGEVAGRPNCRIAPTATPFPEQQVLATLLPRWRTSLLDSLRDLRGRAVLKAELETRQFAFLPRLTLRLGVVNEGLNVAEQVRIGLEASGDYQLLPESEARIELLPPGERREVDLALEPRHPRPMRVLLRVLYNDAVDENRELALADEITFAAAERPFQRIFPIPYVTGTPLKSGDMFYGRQDVFAYIREHLLGTYQNNIIVLHGQRRTGKTSVLYRLPEVLAASHYCVLLDMQGIAVRSESELFYTLSDEIAYALDKAAVPVTLPPRAEYDAQPEFTFRSRFLRGLYPTLGEKHLLLMLDEFEELQRHVEEGHIGPGIFPFLRTIMQHERPVDFIFSGTHKLEDLAAEYWSILFNIATYKQISFLERAEVERLIVEPVAPFGMEYDPLAIRHIHGVTAGHPFLTQLVCHEMVAYHNESERSYITVADVDTVLERIAERGEAHFKYVWAGADGPERLALLALAELLAHTDAATAAEIAARTQSRRQSFDAESALRALIRLESRDIVARTAPGSERFRFHVDLVRRWVARNPQLIDTVTLPDPSSSESSP